ncbi:transposase [Paenibacillus sp. FSL R7-0331]|uniref:transposase n=1 Tax=Paenibacillus sp. FSL R7-0331 TaxID=1536773 RepID=UPI001E57868A|nr:transposase [Paenibacillus sp. FSL R7-0331]
MKLIFVRNRNKKREWLAILSTDVTLDAAEIIRIYSIRWSIETFFKVTKSYLKLGTEFHGRSLTNWLVILRLFSADIWQLNTSGVSRVMTGHSEDSSFSLPTRSAIRTIKPHFSSSWVYFSNYPKRKQRRTK